VAAQIAQEQELRELLRDSSEGLEVLEGGLAAFRVVRPQSRDHKLRDEAGLAAGGGEDRAEVAGVDAEAGESRRRGRDVRLALPVQPVAVLDARDDDAVLLESAQEVERDGRAL